MTKKPSKDKKQKEPSPTKLSVGDLAMLSEYLANGMNGTRAWMATHPNSKYMSAGVSATEWLKNPRIKDEITRIFNEKAMSAEEALGRMADIARATQYHFIEIDDDGFVWFNFADPEAKEHIGLIKKIKTKRERRIDGNKHEWEGEWVEVELHDAKSALQDILKMHGKFIDHVDLTSLGNKIVVTIKGDDGGS